MVKRQLFRREEIVLDYSSFDPVDRDHNIYIWIIAPRLRTHGTILTSVLFQSVLVYSYIQLLCILIPKGYKCH